MTVPAQLTEPPRTFAVEGDLHFVKKAGSRLLNQVAFVARTLR